MLANLSELVVVCLLLGVFGHALFHKIRNWPRFCASLNAYRLMPESAVGSVAIGLIAMETIVVVSFFVDSSTGLMGAAALLMVYLLAIAINMLRGRTHIDCGCGDEPVQLSLWLCLRNGMLVVLAVSISILSQPISWSWLLVLVGTGLGIVAIATYFAIETLLANRSLHHRLWLAT